MSLFRKSVAFRVLAVSYVCFLLCIIMMANLGLLGPWVAWLQRLPFGDKIGHFGLLGMASFCVNLALGCRTITLRDVSFLLGSVAVCVFITLEECSQLFLTHRGFDLGDMACNWAGILVFGQLARWLSRRWLP